MSITTTTKHIRFPFFWQVSLAMGMLVFMSLGLLWGYLQYNLNELLNQQSDTFGQAIARQIAESTAELVMAEDVVTLNIMLANVIAQNENILKIEVLDDQNQTLASEGREYALPAGEWHFDEVAHYQSAIHFHDVIAGTIQLQLDKSPITQSVKATQKIMSVLAIAVGMLFLLVAAFLANRLTKPMRDLKQVANEVALGNLNPELPKPGNNEAGDLVSSFANMLQGLKDKESIEHRFCSYVSPDVAQGILSDLSQTRMPLKPVFGSVLFIDIVGFTQLCENESPQEVADILDHYYFLVHQASKMYHGTVDKFIGDGVMVTFAVSKNDPKHSINSICAAQVFLLMTKKMNSERARLGKSELQFHLGLHCGEMLAGTIGHTERMQFTVVGDTVNVAARLCDMSEPNKLLISDDLYNQPATQGLLITEPVTIQNIKGKSEAIRTHSVVELAPKFNRLFMQQQAEVEAIQVNG